MLLGKQDDLDDFKRSFLKHVRSISAITMMKTMKHIEQELLDCKICWLTADTIVDILKKDEKAVDSLLSPDISEAVPIRKDEGKFLTWLTDQILNQRLLQIIYIDHYFIAVPVMQAIDLIEWGPLGAHIFEQVSTEYFLKYMLDLMNGTGPDRFSGISRPQLLGVLAYNRRPLNSGTIENYIKSNIDLETHAYDDAYGDLHDRYDDAYGDLHEYDDSYDDSYHLGYYNANYRYLYPNFLF